MTMNKAWLRAVFGSNQWHDEVLPYMELKLIETKNSIASENARGGVASRSLIEQVKDLQARIARAKGVEAEVTNRTLEIGNPSRISGKDQGYLIGINVDDKNVQQNLKNWYGITFPDSYTKEDLTLIRTIGWEAAIFQGLPAQEEVQARWKKNTGLNSYEGYALDPMFGGSTLQSLQQQAQLIEETDIAKSGAIAREMLMRSLMTKESAPPTPSEGISPNILLIGFALTGIILITIILLLKRRK